ncbi:MAG: cation:proton antiporter [Thermodesulfobacteriota bacterium]
MITQQIIVTLILILTVAWILGSLFARFGLPVILGELLAGLILGPPLLGIITTSESLELMAEFGIFFLMFYAGMEMDPKELLEHIWPSLVVATGGFVLPFALGFLVCKGFGGTVNQSLFVGMGLSITSLAVQARILHDMELNRSKLGHIIIGAAIADDILALVSLSILLGLAESGSIQLFNVFLVVFKVVVFFTVTILVTHYVIPQFTRRLSDREGKGFTFALLSALVMAFLAELAGLHLIIGAFVAGQFVRKEIMDREVYEKISDRFYGLSYGFLAPIFFVSLSFHLTFTWEWSFIVLTAAITVIAIVGKIVGCGAGALLSRHNVWESAIIGCGMNGRGAVELIVAGVVINLSGELMESHTITEPLLTHNQFSALITMAFITTIIAPLSLKWIVRKACRHDEHAEFCRLWNGGKKP